MREDKTVHETALKLAEAAKEKDLEQVSDRYVDLYQGCVSCHVAHRENIRNSPKW